jgi:ATP-dependent Clp protease ATP-binding subunit ClpA
LRFGLPRDGRPAAVFLFLGPTGTGKTQLSKELARYVYGNEDMMIFLEMGQFQSKESMNMFIGAPPGYVGYGDGKLTNGLGEKPECVVLFDEIEKAEIQVFDALLRFADEGMISDPAGPIRDGRKCIIVMTTNAGQTWLRGHLQANPNARDDPQGLSEQLFQEAMKEMQAKGFRPEFLGRVDERISFLPFTLKVCRQIVDSVLNKEIEKIRKLKGVVIEVTDDARQFMAGKAFERSLDEGARGAPRAVNEFIVTPVIDILAEELADGVEAPSHLVADVEGKNQVLVEVK